MCTSGPNSVITVVLNDADFIYKVRKLDIWPLFCWFWLHFYGACAETPISKLLAAILTTLLDSATPDFLKQWEISAIRKHLGPYGPFFFAHEQSRHYICLRSETCYHRRSQRHRFLTCIWKFWRFDKVSDNFCHTFTAHAQKQLFLSFQLQLWQRSWIQRRRFPIGDGNSAIGKHFTAVLDHFSLCMRRIGIIYASRRNLLSPSFSATSISYNEMEIFDIWQRFR